MVNDILKYGVAWLLMVFFQVFLFNYLTLFQVAIPFVFILHLFLLPVGLPKYFLYPLAFLTGLLVDVFSENMATGLHAFSTLLAVGARDYWLNYIRPTNLRNASDIDLRGQGIIWLISYLFPLILVHHLAYFLLEAMSFSNFLLTIGKVLASSLYSFVLMILITYVFYKR